MAILQRHARPAWMRAAKRRFEKDLAAACCHRRLSNLDGDSPAAVKAANERHAGRVAMQRSKHYGGWGLFALCDFQAGDLLLRASSLQRFATASSHTIQVDWQEHILMDLPARFINHICHEPNVGLILQQQQDGAASAAAAYDFYAMRTIQAGDELLYDYETTEYELRQAFPCRCGSPQCRGHLRGFRFHSQDILQRYNPRYIAPFLLRWQKAQQSPP